MGLRRGPPTSRTYPEHLWRRPRGIWTRCPHTALDPFSPSNRWWSYRKGDPHCLFGCVLPSIWGHRKNADLLSQWKYTQEYIFIHYIWEAAGISTADTLNRTKLNYIWQLGVSEPLSVWHPGWDGNFDRKLASEDVQQLQTRTVKNTDNERAPCSSAVEAKLLIAAPWESIDFYHGVWEREEYIHSKEGSTLTAKGQWMWVFLDLCISNNCLKKHLLCSCLHLIVLHPVLLSRTRTRKQHNFIPRGKEKTLHMPNYATWVDLNTSLATCEGIKCPRQGHLLRADTQQSWDRFDSNSLHTFGLLLATNTNMNKKHFMSWTSNVFCPKIRT